jgi:hypothetical protein
MGVSGPDGPADVRDIEVILRRARPPLGQGKAEELVSEVIRRQGGLASPSPAPRWRSRAAVSALLLIGLALSGSSAGLALSGLSGTDTSLSLNHGVKDQRQDAGAMKESHQSGVVGEDRGKLPFAGWAALPPMAAGLALLASGIILRRRWST